MGLSNWQLNVQKRTHDENHLREVPISRKGRVRPTDAGRKHILRVETLARAELVQLGDGSPQPLQIDEHL